MSVSRRIFIRDGVATVTLGLASPSFLSAIANAQGLPNRRLVVVYLGGGNDSLNTLIGYRDGAYYNRRPSIAVPAGQVLQVGTDASGMAMGLHPRLTGLANIFNEGRLALVQRTGYPNSSRSHFEATDIWGTARVGSVAISIRCRVRSMRWLRGIPPGRRRVRCSRPRPAYQRFRTRAHTHSEARTAVRLRCRSAPQHRPWRSTRRSAVRIWPT